MKNSKRKAQPPPRAAGPVAASRRGLAPWRWALIVAVTFLVVFEVYSPAIPGPFVFDDEYLPFQNPGFAQMPLKVVLMQQRPLMNLSFWLNLKWFGEDPESYHAFGIILHCLNGVLAWLIARRLLSRMDTEVWRREMLAGFAGALFLLHPAQTESVAYVASRSETLSLFFVLSAFLVFLGQGERGISAGRAAAVLGLSAAAIGSKEHGVVLPVLMLLTDYLWTTPYSFAAIRRNWRLYVPFVALGAAGAWFVARVLLYADTAGFRIQGLTWYDYFFTQWRALWVYLRLFVAPFGLNADYDFPISRSVLDHGALFGLLGLVALTAALWWRRRQFPFAFYGWLAFLLLIAPTSSIVPIKDPIAERRLYLPFLGLVIMACDFLRFWKTDRVKLGATLGAVLLACGLLAHARSAVWSSPAALWEDTIRKSPGNSRAHFQLGLTYFRAGKCADAVREYQEVGRIGPVDQPLLLDWGLALDCLNKPEEALAKLQQAVKLKPTGHGYTNIGMVYAKQQKYSDALSALETAERLDPNYEMIYIYRGKVFQLKGDIPAAIEQFEHALRINPESNDAAESLAHAKRSLSGPR